jgi:hypothetical protein
MVPTNKFGTQAHLNDDNFAELWAARDEGAARHPHLAACAQCRTAYGQFLGWLDTVREDAVAEADEAFPSGRLAAQRVSIMSRLEALAPPGRVISFPGQTAPAPVVRHNRARWYAAAVAAGLFLGLGLGQMLSLTGPPVNQVANVRQAPPQVRQPAATPVARDTSVPLDDALFYSDAAVTSPRVEALQALDALTPRVRDIDYPR